MNQKTLQALRKHGLSILNAFPNCTEQDPIALCKKLRRIETATHRVMLDYCNGDASLDDADKAALNASGRVFTLLNMAPPQDIITTGFRVNRDARGYALKLSSEWTESFNHGLRLAKRFDLLIHQDNGQHGILAPDLND